MQLHEWQINSYQYKKSHQNFAVLLVLILIIGIASCGSEEYENRHPNPSENTSSYYSEDESEDKNSLDSQAKSEFVAISRHSISEDDNVNLEQEIENNNTLDVPNYSESPSNLPENETEDDFDLNQKCIEAFNSRVEKIVKFENNEDFSNIKWRRPHAIIIRNHSKKDKIKLAIPDGSVVKSVCLEVSGQFSLANLLIEGYLEELVIIQKGILPKAIIRISEDSRVGNINWLPISQEESLIIAGRGDYVCPDAIKDHSYIACLSD